MLRDDIRARLYRKQKMQFTKHLRSTMTPEEVILWNVLRDRRSRGVKFRRQVNIGPYIADFLCKECHLIVEVDGGIHKTRTQREHDAVRDRYLRGCGFTVFRVKNEEVRSDLPAVLDRIHGRLQVLSVMDK